MKSDSNRPQIVHRKYAGEYVKHLLENGTPYDIDKQRAGDYLELLESLAYSHEHGGTESVRLSWRAVHKYYPDLIKPDKLINANDLAGMKIPEYMKTGYPFYKRAMNILWGQSGAGKSWIAVDFSAKAAAINEASTIIYVAGEGWGAYPVRYEAWVKHHDIRPNNLFFYPEPVDVIDINSINSFMEDIRDKQPMVVVFDTVATCMSGDENSSQDMGRFVENVHYMQEELQCASLLVHHSNKSGGIRGSNALTARGDSVVALSRTDEIIILSNSLENGGKNRYRKEADAQHLRLLPVQVTIQGKSVDSAVIIESDRVLADTAETIKLTSNRQMILEALDGYISGLSGGQIIDMTGIAKKTAYRNLNQLKDGQCVDYNAEHERYQITEIGRELLNNN